MIGVLVMAYGSAQDPDDLPRYYTHIRHGRAPSPEQLDNLRMRYEAIGGFSPLTAITQRQAAGLQEALNSIAGESFQVFLGLKHSPPFIDDAIRDMARAGIKRFVALVLTPHYSAMSVGEYFDEIKEALATHNLSLPWQGVSSWHQNSRFIELVAHRVHEAREKFSPDEQADLVSIFTAHSLPQTIYQQGDPYPTELRQSGEMVAEACGLTRYRYAWQSAGRTGEPWMGPDIVDTVRQLASEGYYHVLICPIGFVSDHLEVLYDLDIECQRVAQSLGVHMERTASFNDDPQFLEMLAHLVIETSQLE
ncbi:ferrochelatase [Sulfobacillus thermosulfidooxidans]|uniref:ferrochelatase n=1 Tax=Sulfobacillus thermosulfidooxidans TaxID=28034 RepID=UPI000AE02516|nr:ferrochelatase [Sulfobacillus thermosulfidooxidans]